MLPSYFNYENRHSNLSSHCTNKCSAYDKWDRWQGSGTQEQGWETSGETAPAAQSDQSGGQWSSRSSFGWRLSWWVGGAAGGASWKSAWGASPDDNDSDDSGIKDGFVFFWFTVAMATYGIYCL